MTARFINGLPQSVIDRYRDENPEEMAKTAGGPRTFYPAQYGGKYHLRNKVTNQAFCDGTTLVDHEQMPISVAVGQDRVHPIICKHCLKFNPDGSRIK